ncbi:hypothetical protein NHP190002_10360 [Helicobacter ailurogastricus]|uniref:tetratricopeptide repeat protein n=1 Tax=Helicobacter ailurogastricus TaxID=1578720 RepID=UPI00244D81F9|nr:tetratricopeptide repeat protein [Helicobacter ailurogastricus]GMB90345.1 hypothetical protein NHP190002_10360 [Helicobacter ailurogastricus]
MQIEHVEQKGTKVHAYDEEGNELFKKSGELVFFVDNYVLVRRGNKICKIDTYGYILDPNFILQIGHVEQKGNKVCVYDEEGNELFKKSGELWSFSSDYVRVKQGEQICEINPYGDVVNPNVIINEPEPEKPEKSMGCFGWLVTVFVVCGALSFIARWVSFNQAKAEEERRAHPVQVFHDAMGLFTQQNYKQAKERFEWLAQIKYRPAFSSYMAGQCAYKEEHYQEAIKFYEQSLKIKEQATYTDILLENLANAYKALKDEKHYTHYKHLLDQQKTGGQ